MESSPTEPKGPNTVPGPTPSLPPQEPDLPAMAKKLMEVPARFRCDLPPKRIMKDPVFKGGKTYERAAIKQHLAKSGNKDPFTGKVFEDDSVDSYTELQTEIQQFVSDQIPKIFSFLPKLM